MRALTGRRLGSALLLGAALAAVAGCSSGRVDSAPGPTAVLAPAPTPAPPALEADAEFGGVVRLEGARLASPSVRAGERAELELAWRLVRSTRRDLGVTVRLVDRDGRTRARRDRTLGGIGAGTSGWAVGEARTDTVALELPEGLEPLRYALAVAVNDPATGAEIPVTAEDGLPPVLVERNHVIGAVRVAPSWD